MNMQTVYRVTGYLSILVGATATLCIFKIQHLYYGLGFAILGFLLAIINIFLNAKYYFDEEKWPKGYIGMFLSSLPVVFLMLVIFKFSPQPGR